VLFVEGPAGIGKTALLQTARERAEEAGHVVLHATGGELERDLPFGVAVQLFEPALRSASARRRRALLTGAASFAAPVLGLPTKTKLRSTDHYLLGGDSRFSALHGLYWLCANLAQFSPLLLCIDDLHWCDQETLRWLSYSVRRLEGLALGLVLSGRPAEPGVEHGLQDALRSEAPVVRLALAPLSVAASAEVVRELVGGPVDDGFCIACHAASAGNPLLLHELVRSAVAEGVDPSTLRPADAHRLAPERIAHSVLLRLGRPSAAAVKLARAVAVLGADTSLDVAAAVTGLEQDLTARLASALGDAGIFAPAAKLEFIHPVVRSALYKDMQPALRTRLHARAARVLTDRGAQVEVVADHLLGIPAAHDAEAVALLRRAAAMAASRGAPEAAARYLRRALAEAASEVHAAILHDLGRIETELGDPSAIEHLRLAVASTTDLRLRADATLSLAHSLIYTGRGPEAVDAIDPALLQEVDRVDRELGMRLEAKLITAQFLGRSGMARRLPARASLTGATLGERELLGARVVHANNAQQAAKLLEAAVGNGQVLPEQFQADSGLFHALVALVWYDRLDTADAVLDRAIADARARGSPLGLAQFGYVRSLVFYRRGRIADAAAEAWVAHEIAVEGDWNTGVAMTLAALLDALREQGAWNAGERALARAGLERRSLGLAAVLLPASRARFRLAQGRVGDAIQDLIGLEPVAAALPHLDASHGICATLAQALAAHGERSHAVAAADAAVSNATQWQLPRAIATALMAKGLAVVGQEGVDLVRNAVDRFAAIPAPLEAARARVELGAMLRRANSRAEAREPLQAGMDAAVRCGAIALGMRAHEELRATGARPRRLLVRGIDALTPSELRVATMAAEGMSNRDIAEALFVSAKTVDTHLMHIYGKLGIHSRSELAGALNQSDGEIRPVIVPSQE
jgi:DNA-binding CsgD family transcriptional regulator